MLVLPWHPDGQRISVWVWDNSDPVSLWTAAAEQGTAVKSQISPEILKQIGGISAGFSGFSEWADDFKFSWAPSGKAIYFERTFRGVRNIWRMTVDPKTLQAIAIERVTTGSGLDTEFSLSPDGKKLAFTSKAESIRAWMFPFDATRGQVTGAGRAVTTPGTVALRPVLSRDGKRLAFCGNRAGKWGLREVSLSDNRDVQIVPNDPYGVDRPQWSPDGTQLAYVRENPTTQESQLMSWIITAIFTPSSSGNSSGAAASTAFREANLCSRCQTGSDHASTARPCSKRSRSARNPVTEP